MEGFTVPELIGIIVLGNLIYSLSLVVLTNLFKFINSLFPEQKDPTPEQIYEYLKKVGQKDGPEHCIKIDKKTGDVTTVDADGNETKGFKGLEGIDPQTLGDISDVLRQMKAQREAEIEEAQYGDSEK